MHGATIKIILICCSFSQVLDLCHTFAAFMTVVTVAIILFLSFAAFIKETHVPVLPL